MKILVYAHELELGGSQTNSIDLAAAVRDRFGHEVRLFATPGPAGALAARKDLELIEAPKASKHPSPTMMRALERVVRDWRPDIVHAWEWPQIADACFGPQIRHRTRVVASNMSMAVLRSIPGGVPLTVGYPGLVEASRDRRSGPVVLVEPPVDTAADDPAVIDGSPFRAATGVPDGACLIVVVSRLVDWMKADGIARAIDAMPELTGGAVLAVVGEGSAAPMLEARAQAANARAGRRVAVLTGALADPRPAYAAADIMLGMGGSALRGMAFGKPTVVLGEGGFARLFDEQSATAFLRHGFYGVDRQEAPSELPGILDALVGDSALRERVGRLSYETVRERFSLDAMADRLDALYKTAPVPRRWPALLDLARTVPSLVRSQTGRGGRSAADATVTGAAPSVPIGSVA